MKTTQVNLRLEPELIRSLEAAASAESLERGTMMRKLMIEGLAAWKLQHALRRYQAGEISIGRATEESGRSHWELIELAQSSGIAYRIDVDDSIARARALMAQRRDRVADGSSTHQPSGLPTPPADATASRASASRGRDPATGGSDGTMGTTLPDLPPRPGGVLVVGINPAPRSVERGHYYQGKLGARLWKRLAYLGLLRDAVPGLEDAALTAGGHGLTDIVKRVTASADELTTQEFHDGAIALRAKVRQWRPRLVLFVFKAAAVHALGQRGLSPGRCGDFEGVPAFLLSGPYAKTADSKRIDRALKDLLDS